MKIKSLPMEERPMEKMLASGPRTLSNAELIAIIIRTGTKSESAIGLAERILSYESGYAYKGGLSGIVNLSPEELMAIPGIGRTKACAVAAIGELTRRVGATESAKRIDVNSASEAAKFFMDDLRFEKKEHFKSLLLDVKGKLIYVDEISVGDLNATPVHPREVFKNAVKKSAASMIVVHNHPSGDPTPSIDDIALTTRLVSAGQIMGIKVLDHIVIGDGEYYSFAAMGQLENS